MSLKKNILNLLGTQVVSYLIPLLQLPYLSRVLGGELLGLYIFSISIINLYNIITAYGFDLSISKRIAEGENSKKSIGIFLYHTILIKTVLYAICVLSLIPILFSLSYYSYLQIALLLTAIFGNSYNLMWLFQGIEKLYIYSRVVILTKLASFICIFLLIHSKSDINILFTLLALQSIISTIIQYIYISKKYSIIYDQLSNTLLIAKESFEFFISRLGSSIYSMGGSFFLGILSGNLHQVAIYGVAEQLYKAGVYTMTTVSTPLIPYMARTHNFKLFFKITLLSVSATCIGSLIGIFFGDSIISLIFGNGLSEAYIVLCIFMITLIVSIVGIHFGYPALIPLGKARIANISTICGGLLQLIMFGSLYFLNIEITALVVAILYLLCDSLMTLIRIYYFIREYRKTNVI